jgi:GNAT superfamily N-acetyltransferase
MGKKKSNASTTSTSTTSSNTTGASTSDAAKNAATPKLMLRTYRPTDFEAVRQLYIATLFALVPEGVRRKLWSVTTWVIWFTGFTLLLKLVPKYVLKAIFPSVDLETSNGVAFFKVILTFIWALVGFSAMFIVTERFEIAEKVHQGLTNDLNDPEAVYLQYEPLEENNKDDNSKVRQRKTTRSEDDTDVDEHIPGHFWVLLANDEVCGMMGLAPASKEPLLDSRPLILPIWKQVVQALGRNVGLSLFETVSSTTQRPVIIAAQPQHTATIVRWAVANEYQQCGLSSLLIHRALTWAKENGLTDVYATTNEIEMAAEQILEKRHGFKLVKKQKIGWFGRYECLWVCHVDDWVEQNKNHVNSRFKPSDNKK